MSQSNPLYSISNEQLLLINILNTMYNDNLNQIQNLTSSNNEIRNLIIRILNNNQRGRSNTNNRQRQQYTRDLRNNNNNDALRNNDPLLFEYVFELQPYMNNNNNNTRGTATNNDTFSRIFQRFLEPIEVYPTPSQIEAATRIARYGDIIAPRNRSCPISLENFNDNDTVAIIRFCGHTFNRDELNTWFRTNCRCPVCRYDIRNYNPNATENAENSVTENIHNDVPNAASNAATNAATNTTEIPNPNNMNTIYQNLLSSGAEELLNFILDPSGNTNEVVSSTNIIQNILNNYQRRRQ